MATERSGHMTGPEHYLEAERLLDLAFDLADPPQPGIIAAAQVHATLADAAATISTDRRRRMSKTNRLGWSGVTG